MFEECVVFGRPSDRSEDGAIEHALIKKLI